MASHPVPPPPNLKRRRGLPKGKYLGGKNWHSKLGVKGWAAIERELRAGNGTLASLGRKYGVTTERVRQLAKRFGVTHYTVEEMAARSRERRNSERQARTEAREEAREDRRA